MVFQYYTNSDDSNSEAEEDEEEEEEGIQPLQDSILRHVERNWVPEINFDSSVMVQSTSTTS